MNSLATWVMKKRFNAITGVALLSLIPMMFWLAAAIQGLVVLRKGVAEGISVLLPGSIPALMLWYYQGDVSALMVLLLTTVLAGLLRTSVLWGVVLISASFLALVNVFLLPLLMPDYLALITDLFRQLLQEILKGTGQVGMSQEQLHHEVIVSLSVVQSGIAVLALLLARKWQAALYNPGGFKKEFHQLRLPLSYALILGALVLAGESLGEEYRFLSQVSVPALLVAGLALVHGVLAQKRIGNVGLIAVYLIGLVFFSVYFVNALIVLAIVDSFVDIRRRIGVSSDSNES